MWIDAVVERGELAYPAQVNVWWRDRTVAARFSAETMGRIVEDFHAQHEQRAQNESAPDTSPDLLWDGTTVLSHAYKEPGDDEDEEGDEDPDKPYYVRRIEPDPGGWYHFAAAWSVRTEPWPERDEVLSRVRASELVDGLCRMRLHLEPLTARYELRPDPTDVEMHLRNDALDASYTAAGCLDYALAAEGVPAGHLREVGEMLYAEHCARYEEPPF